MYQYSLAWFTGLFGALVRQTPRRAPDRAAELVAAVRFGAFSAVCRSLFDRDRLLFALLLAALTLRREGALEPAEWAFFATGGLFGGEGAAAANPAPAWLPAPAWSALARLARLPGLAAFPARFAKETAGWRTVFEGAEPHAAAFPGAPLPPFHRLLVLRCLRPDSVVPAARAFVAETLGERFARPPPATLQEALDLSTPASPLLFVLSSGVDFTGELLALAERAGRRDDLSIVSLGQGQGPAAARLLLEASRTGKWLLLANCHLAGSWLHQLERMCENFVPEALHPNFRLWLTSQPKEDFPLLLLRSSLKITSEAPRGLRAALARSLAASGGEPELPEASAREWRRLRFALCLAHAVVLERREFGPLGWSAPYEFHDADRAAALAALREALRRAGDGPPPWRTWRGRPPSSTTAGAPTATTTVPSSGPSSPRRTAALGSAAFHCRPTGPSRITSPSPPRCPTMATPPPPRLARRRAEAASLLEAVLATQFTVPRRVSRAGAPADAATVVGGGGGGAGAGGASSNPDAHAVAGSVLEALAGLSVGPASPSLGDGPLQSVLAAESARFERLLREVANALRTLRLALEGRVPMSPEREDTAAALAAGRVPESWYVADLAARVAFFAAWAAGPAPPAAFWLPAFFSPHAFLAAARQAHARAAGASLVSVRLAFDVPVRGRGAAPERGVLVRGLFLDGARWDEARGALGEQRPGELYPPLPPLWLPTRRAPHPLPPSLNHVVDVALPSDAPAGHWLQRGVALLCHPPD
eukprot:tig00000248_g21808.t1